MQPIDIGWNFHFHMRIIEVQEDALVVNLKTESRVFYLLISAQNYISFLTAILATS